MKKEKAMRQCIKCGKIVPLGWFNDNDRHKSNICKDCRTYYRKHQEYPKVIMGYMFAVGDNQRQIIYANTQEEATRLLEEKLPGWRHELLYMFPQGEPWQFQNCSELTLYFLQEQK